MAPVLGQRNSIRLSTATLQLQTRLLNHIDNFLSRAAPTPGMQKQVADFKRDYNRAVHRPTTPCATYNCHGLTFAARRTQINDPADVAMILAEDDYVPIKEAGLLPGDIAVYFVNGDIEHSGIVVAMDNYGPKILSKWGSAHEVIHRKAECEYDATDVRFFRVGK